MKFEIWDYWGFIDMFFKYVFVVFDIIIEWCIFYKMLRFFMLLLFFMMYLEFIVMLGVVGFVLMNVVMLMYVVDY